MLTVQMWKSWREKELKRDEKFAHERWPEEMNYINSEKEELENQKPQYFSDLWLVMLKHDMFFVSSVQHFMFSYEPRCVLFH